MNAIKRVISAIVAGGIIFAILYAGTRYEIPWIVAILILVVAYLAAVEYLQLMRRLEVPLAVPEFLIWIPVLIFGYVLFDGRYGDGILLLAIAYQVLRYLGSTPHRTGFLQAVAGVFGLLYIPWLLHFFYSIYIGSSAELPYLGATHTLIVLLMVWGYDTGARHSRGSAPRRPGRGLPEGLFSPLWAHWWERPSLQCGGSLPSGRVSHTFWPRHFLSAGRSNWETSSSRS